MSSQNSDEIKAFKREAKDNWETILLCRAKEMHPGNTISARYRKVYTHSELV